MYPTIHLYSNQKGEINKFLSIFYHKNINIDNNLSWKKEYINPIEIADIIGCLIDNNDKFTINLWINLDQNLLINVTDNNVDDIIKYLYERFPY